MFEEKHICDNCKYKIFEECYCKECWENLENDLIDANEAVEFAGGNE